MPTCWMAPAATPAALLARFEANSTQASWPRHVVVQIFTGLPVVSLSPNLSQTFEVCQSAIQAKHLYLEHVKLFALVCVASVVDAVTARFSQLFLRCRLSGLADQERLTAMTRCPTKWRLHASCRYWHIHTLQYLQQMVPAIGIGTVPFH